MQIKIDILFMAWIMGSLDKPEASMKQKELMRNKALYDALEEFDSGGYDLETRKKMTEAILTEFSDHEDKLVWQVELFQSAFRLAKHAKINERGGHVLMNKMEKTKKFIEQQFAILDRRRKNSGLGKQIEDLKAANKELKKREKAAQAKAAEYEAMNAQIKIKLDEHKKSVDNMSAELGRLKRKIQKGRL